MSHTEKMNKLKRSFYLQRHKQALEDGREKEAEKLWEEMEKIDGDIKRC